MKLNTIKRMALGGLVALSLSGGSLATFAAGTAAAATDPAPSSMNSADVHVCDRIQGRWVCYDL